MNCGSRRAIEFFSMLLLSMQAQYRGNRQYRCEHNGHAHKSPRMTVVSLLDAAFGNKLRRRRSASLRKYFARPYRPRLLQT